MSAEPSKRLSDQEIEKIRAHSQSVSNLPVADDKKANAEVSAIKEGKYEELERIRVETDALRQRNEDLKKNRELRSGYARSVFRYLVGYSCFVGATLVFSGFKIWGFSLPNEVLSFLVGSTAAAAIGLVYAVTHGLFDGIGKQ